MNVVYLSGALQGYDGETAVRLVFERDPPRDSGFAGYDTVHLGNGISVPHTNIGFGVRRKPLRLELPQSRDTGSRQWWTYRS